MKMNNSQPPGKSGGPLDNRDGGNVPCGSLPSRARVKAAQKDAKPLSREQTRNAAETLAGDPIGLAFGDSR